MRPGIRKTLTLSFRATLFVPALLLTACATSYWINPRTLSANLAEYSIKPDHKAFYIYAKLDGKYTGLMGYAWGQSSTRQAEVLAKRECEQAVQEKGISGDCHPYAVDNHRTGWDISPYIHDPSESSDGQVGGLEMLQSALAGANALQAIKANQPAAVEHYMQDLTAVQQRRKMEENQQAGNALIAAQGRQNVALDEPLPGQPGSPPSRQSEPAPRSSGTPAAGAGHTATLSSECRSAMATTLGQWCTVPNTVSACDSAQAGRACFEHVVHAMQGVCPRRLTARYTRQEQAATATSTKACGK